MFCSRTRFWPVLLGLFFFLRSGLVADVFTVVNADSSGPGSLAQAAADAYSLPGPHQIVFAIPGPGVHKIDLGNKGIALGSSVTVDGYTQPGASPNTLAVGDNAVILIQLDGGGPFLTQSVGLSMGGNNCVVRGLSITGFSGVHAGTPAITIGNFVEGGNGNRIEGNFIGLEPDGVTLNGNDYGIYFYSGNENGSAAIPPRRAISYPETTLEFLARLTRRLLATTSGPMPVA